MHSYCSTEPFLKQGLGQPLWYVSIIWDVTKRISIKIMKVAHLTLFMVLCMVLTPIVHFFYICWHSYLQSRAHLVNRQDHAPFIVLSILEMFEAFPQLIIQTLIFTSGIINTGKNEFWFLCLQFYLLKKMELCCLFLIHKCIWCRKSSHIIF